MDESMKAMEAPKKIYLTQLMLFATPTISSSDNDVEYTRTDAFIERACSWLKENKDKYLYNTGERDEYIPTCSGKMIDDFRKYMEGE